MPSVVQSEPELSADLSAQQAWTWSAPCAYHTQQHVSVSPGQCRCLGVMLQLWHWHNSVTFSSVQLKASVSEQCASRYADSFATFCNDTAEHVNIKLHCLVHLKSCYV